MDCTVCSDASARGTRCFPLLGPRALASDELGLREFSRPGAPRRSLEAVARLRGHVSLENRQPISSSWKQTGSFRGSKRDCWHAIFSPACFNGCMTWLYNIVPALGAMLSDRCRSLQRGAG